MAIIRLSEPISKKSLWVASLSELVGTFLLVVLGVGIIYVNAGSHAENVMPNGARTILSAAGFGIVVGGLVFALGFGFTHGSAHLNPAFTLGCLVLDKVTVARALIFTIAQTLGAILAGGFLFVVHTKMRVPANQTDVTPFACTVLAPGVEPIQGFGFEFVGTFVLVFGALAAIGVCERQNYGAAVVASCLTIIIAMVIVVIGPYTGASINPARSLGPAVFFGGNCWLNHWIYWAAPLAGGLLGGAMVRILLYTEEEPPQQEQRKGEVVELHETQKLVVTTNA